MVKALSPEEEDRRRLCRERKTLIAERVEHVNRIKGLLVAQGICDYEPLHRDRRTKLGQLKTGDGRPLPSNGVAFFNGCDLDDVERDRHRFRAAVFALLL
jgi:transposase